MCRRRGRFLPDAFEQKFIALYKMMIYQLNSMRALSPYEVLVVNHFCDASSIPIFTRAGFLFA